MADDKARYRAMVEFLGTFPTLSGSPPEEMADLSDGVALFEVLSEMYVHQCGFACHEVTFCVLRTSCSNRQFIEFF